MMWKDNQFIAMNAYVFELSSHRTESKDVTFGLED